jgi:hypothetical protein
MSICAPHLPPKRGAYHRTPPLVSGAPVPMLRTLSPVIETWHSDATSCNIHHAQVARATIRRLQPGSPANVSTHVGCNWFCCQPSSARSRPDRSVQSLFADVGCGWVWEVGVGGGARRPPPSVWVGQHVLWLRLNCTRALMG